MRVMRRFKPKAAMVGAMAMLLVGIVGCEKNDASPGAAGETRAVVLSPAITRIIIDLGKGETIVGVGQYDPAADRYPVVGDLYQTDYEKLLAVEPTDLFLQPAADGVPTKLRQLAAERGWRIHSYQIETIRDVKRAIYDGSGRGIGMALGASYEAIDLIDRIDAQLLAIGEAVAGRRAPRTLLLVGLNPINAAGRETFLHEMLLLAGGLNAITDDANDYPVLLKEDLLALKPEVIVIADPSDANVPFDQPTWLKAMDIPAVTGGRVLVLSDPHVLLPSSTVPRITAKLAKLLHPDLAGTIDQAMADVVQP